jgi:hypothetical protein
MTGIRGLLLLACLPLAAARDLDSGPFRTTIQSFTWGTLFYEPRAGAPVQLERTAAGFRFSSGQGQVQITGSEYNGLRLAWEKESLTITHLNGIRGIEVRDRGQVWTLSVWFGALTLAPPERKDTVVYERNGNVFTIKGPRGTVTVSTQWGDVRVQSPLGTTTILGQPGRRSFAGPALEDIPYLGRGLFLSFHGVGVFLDVTRYFPMPELVEWLEWTPLNLDPVSG